mgnify:CR=1 FL=1
MVEIVSYAVIHRIYIGVGTAIVHGVCVYLIFHNGGHPIDPIFAGVERQCSAPELNVIKTRVAFVVNVRKQGLNLLLRLFENVVPQTAKNEKSDFRSKP